MTVEILCLCKSVQIDNFNQPTLIAIFDKKIAAGEPALIEPFFAVASIRFFKTDIGTHRFEFVVNDLTGQQIQASQEIISITDMKDESTTFFLQCFMPQRLSNFGTYWFSIQSGGMQLAKTPLYVTIGKAS